MAQHEEHKTIDDAVELLKTNGFDGLADAVTILINTAMLSEREAYLGAKPYERVAERRSYANGFKDKTVKSRLGELRLKVPQTRDCGLYPPKPGERPLLGARADAGGGGDVYPGCFDAPCEGDCRGDVWARRLLDAGVTGSGAAG